MGVKIITSSKASVTMRTAFLAGLGDAGHPNYALDVKERDGNYDDGEGAAEKHHELYDDMLEAENDEHVEVIISAGGLVTAHAANQIVKKTPFLILVGQEPKFVMNSPMYFGGVDLDMVDENADRHDYLVNHYGVAADKICLIWNSNSKMGKHEKGLWARKNWPNVEVAINTEAEITKAIMSAKDKADAVVISGDPYFAGHMNAVVAAVNDQTKKRLRVCYPFRGYAAATPLPATGVSMYYGPDLEYAYRMMGRKAGTILSNKKNPQHSPLDPHSSPHFLK